jgi:hypothetical protein
MPFPCTLGSLLAVGYDGDRMMASTSISLMGEQVLIVRTHEESELDRITLPSVQAVVYTPNAVPKWLYDVEDAVEQEFLQIPRTILPAANQQEIDVWIEDNVPSDVLLPSVHTALKQDILSMTERISRLTGALRFHFRIFTGAPTRKCGFHVDTVAPGTASWGLLRVFNGVGTEYVDPDDVVDMHAFYRYLSSRERLERERNEACTGGDTERYSKLEAEIQILDQERVFMTHSGRVRVAPCRSIVAFKHLDVSLHWSDHSKALAWIHCSPMAGKPRLVVNVTAASTGLGSTRPGTGGMIR